MFESVWTEVNGLRTHAVRAGEGPPVVLVHGLGLSHRYMTPVAERLARRFAVWIPDLPGFGDSEHPREVLDIPGLGAALGDWMRATELARASLLGNSQGCQIILALAAARPERVERVVLQGPTCPPEERSWFWQAVRWRQNNRFNPKSMGDASWPEYRKSGYGRVLKTFHLGLKDRPEDAAPRVRASALVVRGERDPICRRPWAERLTAALPDARLVELPDCAHTLVWTRPDELAAVSTSFLLGDEGRGRA